MTLASPPSTNAALFQRYWAKYCQLDRLKPAGQIITDLVFTGAADGDFSEIDIARIEQQGVACQLTFDLRRGFTIAVGLRIGDGDGDGDIIDGFVWLRGNLRWLFMDFLQMQDGYDDTPANPEMRAAAKTLRQFADLADYIADENEKRHLPTRDNQP